MTNEQIFHKTIIDIDDGNAPMDALIKNLGTPKPKKINEFIAWCELNGHLELIEVIND